MPIIDNIAEYAADIETFDELVPRLLEFTRKASTKFFLKMMEVDKFPMGMTLEEYRVDFIKNGPKDLSEQIKKGIVNVDVFCFGYSHKEKSMGWALVESLEDGGFRQQEKYAPFLWFMSIDPIRGYAAGLGHKPETNKEMAEGLRLVYKSRLDPDFPIAVGGGHIQMTTVYPDKKITTEMVGLLIPGQNIKSVKKKRKKRKKQNH